MTRTTYTATIDKAYAVTSTTYDVPDSGEYFNRQLYIEGTGDSYKKKITKSGRAEYNYTPTFAEAKVLTGDEAGRVTSIKGLDGRITTVAKLPWEFFESNNLSDYAVPYSQGDLRLVIVTKPGQPPQSFIESTQGVLKPLDDVITQTQLPDPTVRNKNVNIAKLRQIDPEKIFGEMSRKLTIRAQGENALTGRGTNPQTHYPPEVIDQLEIAAGVSEPRNRAGDQADITVDKLKENNL